MEGNRVESPLLLLGWPSRQTKKTCRVGEGCTVMCVHVEETPSLSGEARMNLNLFALLGKLDLH